MKVGRTNGVTPLVIDKITVSHLLLDFDCRSGVNPSCELREYAFGADERILQ